MGPSLGAATFVGKVGDFALAVESYIMNLLHFMDTYVVPICSAIIVRLHTPNVGKFALVCYQIILGLELDIDLITNPANAWKNTKFNTYCTKVRYAELTKP